MAGWLHGVFVGDWLFVFPLCGFSLSLFCNYITGPCVRPNTCLLYALISPGFSPVKSPVKSWPGLSGKKSGVLSSPHKACTATIRQCSRVCEQSQTHLRRRINVSTNRTVAGHARGSGCATGHMHVAVPGLMQNAETSLYGLK